MFAWYAFILTKQTITSCSVMEKFWKVIVPSHDRVCDDRIGHLNHMRSLIVLFSKVNNLPFCKFEFSQERRCHGSVKMTVSEWRVWFRLEWLTRPLQTTLILSRITISRLIWWFVFDKQERRMTDPVRQTACDVRTWRQTLTPYSPPEPYDNGWGHFP